MNKMKFKIMLVLLHIIVLNASAQKYSAGLSTPFRSSTAQTPEFRQKNIFSYGLGVSGIKHSSHKLFYQIGLNYIHHNEKDENQPDFRVTSNGWEEVGGADFNIKDSFISFPVDFNYKVFNSNGVNLLLSAGATLDWLVYRTIIRNSTFDGKATFRGHVRREDKFRSFITFGVGGYFPIKNNTLLLIKPKVLYQIDEAKDRVNLGLSIHLFKNLKFTDRKE